MNPLVVSAVTAATTALTITPIVRGAAIRGGYMDVPNERSSHVRPTPRTGGFAILVGLAAGTGAAGAWREGATATTLLGTFGLALMALVDDWRPLSRLLRLVLQVALLAAVLTALASTGAIAWPASRVLTCIAWTVALVWLLGLVNTYNFMDGLNGIAGLSAAVTGATLALLALRRGDLPSAVLATSVASAVLGFLPFNMIGGSIFMGDAGSTVLGLVLGALVLHAASLDHLPVAAALPLAPFVLDAGTTVIRRALRGERFFSTPHRSHYYQQLQQQGWSHAAVATLYACLTLACASVALAFDKLSLGQQVAALVGIVIGHAALFARIHAGWRRHIGGTSAGAATHGRASS